MTVSGERPVQNIVVVGGGTAGWLAACSIAARAPQVAAASVTVTLIESPDIPTIGVGEGTWPTMRATLERIGIDEADFLVACDASFKQGSRFIGWRDGSVGDSYLHPFSPPIDGAPRDIVQAWQRAAPDALFADAVCPQGQVARADLAPRQRAMPPYAGALNYAYHVDAAKLAALMAKHGTERLGVRRIADHVVGIDSDDGGDIAGVRTREGGTIAGDLFIDCSGLSALLIGTHFGSGFRDFSAVLPNDRALAVQVPVAPDSPIASQTDATAHSAGWIWDIGLPTRRGIGCVYASRFMDDEVAEATLAAYLQRKFPSLDPAAFTPRKLSFRSGHRERFWVRNCLAIGLSAGFLEPLEASAIVLIELSIDALIDGFPATRAVMDAHAARFNTQFAYRWDRIVEFLKLHYVLSTRDEPYWRAHREASGVPPRLAALLDIWRYQPPSRADFPAADEIFPAASHQYVLYGMGFPAPPAAVAQRTGADAAVQAMQAAAQRGRALAASLPTNRAYLDALARERMTDLRKQPAA